MSSEVAIAVDGLSKCYQIYANPADRLKQMLFRGRRQYFREFWALHDVSFTVARGESVGIVGRNGSGKSTLLQLICGTLNPTSGSVRAQGRIAALLELGSGFNPEFTGRENVFLNGTILGLAHEQIAARYDEIAAFAEIGDFIDQPVKTYSSGMYVRLAFAVQVCLDPEILIVDEALAVGDAYFVHRCFHRIRALKAQGTTILFVSHDTGSVKDLCDRALWIDAGRLAMIGRPEEVTTRYRAHLFGIPMQDGAQGGGHGGGHGGAQGGTLDEAPAGGRAGPAGTGTGPAVGGMPIAAHESVIPNADRRLGRQRCRLVGIGLYDVSATERLTELQSGQVACLRISFVNDRLPAGTPLIVGYGIITPRGEELGVVNTEMEGVALTAAAAGERMTVRARIELPVLHVGNYALTVGLASRTGVEPEIEDRIENAMVFRIVGGRPVYGWIHFPTQFAIE